MSHTQGIGSKGRLPTGWQVSTFRRWVGRIKITDVLSLHEHQYYLIENKKSRGRTGLGGESTTLVVLHPRCKQDIQGEMSSKHLGLKERSG